MSAAPLQRSIIIAGATGAIGRELVSLCVANPAVGRIVALSRRPSGPEEWPKIFPNLNIALATAKLCVVEMRWDELLLSPSDAKFRSDFSGHDIAANCLGTTRKDAGSAEAFRKVDLEYAQAFAAAVRFHSRSCYHFAQVSAQNANSAGWFLYTKTKGQADDMLVSMGFPFAEWCIKFMSISVEKVAAAMLKNALVGSPSGSGSVGGAGQPFVSGDKNFKCDTAGSARVFYNADIMKICNTS